MKKLILSGLTVFFLMLPLPTLAEESLDEVVQGLQKEVDSMKDWQADFTQKAYNALVRMNETSTGTVKIKKPGKILWKYLKPELQVLASDGKKIYFYAKEDKQVMIRDLQGSGLSGANLLFLAGTEKIKDLFQVQLLKETKAPEKTVLLKMTPKKPQPNLSYLVLGVDESSFEIQTLQTFDSYENNTYLEFSNLKKNSKLPDKIFKFKIPKGVEVQDTSGVME